ncbi:MAG: LamG domain-containing protein [Phycisphaerae bacterium]
MKRFIASILVAALFCVPCSVLAAEYNVADLNQDNIVDYADLAVMADNWLVVPPVEPSVEPIHYWAFDEAEGDVILDSAGDADGTADCFSSNFRVDGVLGSALDIAYEGDSVSIPGYKGILGSASRTCAAWIKTEAYGANIIGWGLAGETGAKWALNASLEGKLMLSVGGGGTAVYGTAMIADGNWHHIVVTLAEDDNTTTADVKMYVDGVLDESSADNYVAVSTTASYDVTIGSPVGTTAWEKVTLDEVMIYNRAISAEEAAGLAGVMLSEPVHHWAFDEATGSIVLDSAGEANGVVLSTSSDYRVDGVIGGALDFAAEGDSVVIPCYKGILGSASRTCSAWIKTEAYGANIIGWGLAGETGAKWALNASLEGKLMLSVGGGGTAVYGTAMIADGDWHHIVVTLAEDDNTTTADVKMYVDGVLDESSADNYVAVSTTASYDVTIGSPVGTTAWEKVTLDEVMIYNRAISAEEAAGLAGVMLSEPVHHWAFDEATGSIVLDSAGEANGVVLSTSSDYRVDGVIGGALDFAAEGDSVVIPCYKGILGSASRTCSAWIKTEAYGANIIGWGMAGETATKWALNASLEGKLMLSIGGGSANDVYGTAMIADGNWHHIVVAVAEDDNTTTADVKMYVDGVLDEISKSSDAPINTASSYDVTIGSPVGMNGWYPITLDDVKIYNRAISAEEVAELLFR